MPIERRRVELGQAVDLADGAVEAVTDWDVDQAVVGAQGHGGLGPLLGQGVKAGTSATPEDDAQHRLQHEADKEMSCVCWGVEMETMWV